MAEQTCPKSDSEVQHPETLRFKVFRVAITIVIVALLAWVFF